MNATGISNFDIFDILVKIIPGGIFISFILFMIPISSSATEIFAGGGFGLILGALPLAYIIGTILQGLSGTCFPRQKNFQEVMKDARENLTINKDEMEISGGDPVPRFVWADAIVYFKLDKKYLQPSSSNYEPRYYPKPVLYNIVCYPILRISTIFSRLKTADLDRTRKYYGSEREVFRLVEQYVDSRNLGKIDRFRSIYVLHRSMTILACIMVHLFIFSILAAQLTNYQPVVGWRLLIILAVGSFLSIPVLYKGMIRYEGIRDRRIIYAYYNSRIKDSPLSDEYAIE